MLVSARSSFGMVHGKLSLTRATLSAFAACLLLTVGSRAHGAVVMTIQEVGSDVVSTASGTLNVSALDGPLEASSQSFLRPSLGIASVGPVSPIAGDVYTDASGPTSFGPGGATPANTASGDLVAILGFGDGLYVPDGYVSGSALAGTATYSNTTLANLGLTPGTYVWTWGSGPTADSFTLEIGGSPAVIPAPAALAVLPAMLAFLIRRRQA